MVRNSHTIPSTLKFGYCIVCTQPFEYSRAVKPPKTCGMLHCMVKAGEEVAT